MSSPNKSWTVVCFLADESVEAVPSRWINGDDCLWPAVTREKLHNLIKKCEFNSCWPSHKVRTFRNATYDNYVLARKKAAKAEMTSDLNNTDDGEATRTPCAKRIRKKKVFSSSDSENSDIDEPLSKIKKIPAAPTWTDFDQMIDADAFKENDNLQEGEQSLENSRENYCSQSSGTPEAKRGGPLQQIKENLNNGTPSTSHTRQGCCCNPQLLYNIQALLVEINTKLSRKCTHEEQDYTNILEKSNIDFPIKTKENLKEFESFLSVTENYSALVQLFTKMGGSNSYEFIRRCVAPLVSDVLAEQFSFLGKKGKDTFSTTALAKSIIDAAHKSGISNNRKEIELKIGDWLRRAKERRVRAEIKNNN